MTSELAHRIDRVLTLLLGALFLTGAAWCLLALAVGAWPGIVSRGVYLATIVAAGAVGVAVLAVGWSGRTMPTPLAAVLVACGSVAVALVAGSAGPHGAAVLGGMFTYVTAISFLWFRLPVALAQLGLAGLVHVLALRVADAPGAAATWLVTLGIAAGGAGLVGALGSWLRRLYLVETDLAARLREADLLKSTFLQAVSHELRTPLAAVRGFSETLDEHHGRLRDDQVADMLARLRGASERLDALLGDLLDVERLQRGDVRPHRAPCDVQELLERVLDDLPAEDHHVEVDVPAFDADIDAAKVERVLANLLRNAVKHTPAGTRVRVRARPWTDAQAGGRGVEIEVADDGPGLDPTRAARIFEPFEQGGDAAQAASPGIGLGLAIVHRFTQLHGGRVHAGPGLDGRGVAFHLRIPGGEQTADETAGTALDSVLR